MKQLHYLYADFETTAVNIDGYDNMKDYYENNEERVYPKIYSWAVTHSNKYKNVNGLFKPVKHKQLESFKETDSYVGISGGSFVDFLENITCDSIMYFNNLKGFDGHFLIPELDKKGYRNVLPIKINEVLGLNGKLQIDYIDRVLQLKKKVLKSPTVKKQYEILKKLNKDEAESYVLNRIERIWNILQPKEYSVMTDGSKNIYEIKVGIEDTKSTKGKVKNRAVIIRDNLLLFPSSVAKMGETIVKEYLGRFKELNSKGHFDKDIDIKKILEDKYHKKDLSSKYKRYDLFESEQELFDTGNELQYLIQDTYIVYKFHEQIDKYFPKKTWKMTIGGTVYDQWITSFGNQLTNIALEEGKAVEVELKRGAKRIRYNGKLYNTQSFNKLMVNTLLPTKWLDKQYSEENTYHQELYKYYDGGITRVNEDYRGQLVTLLTFLDINSSYPSQMVKDVMVPYGVGLKGDVKGYDFKFYTLRPKRNITNKKGLPFLHNEFANKREYLKVLKPGTQYKFTSITYERFLKYYKCKREDYELVVEFSFKQLPISTFFKEFIMEWYDIKEQAGIDGKEILKLIAKLFMNNLYGKLGTKTTRESHVWNQEYQEWIKYEDTTESKFYLPLGIVIAELGRMSLVDAVDENHDKFVYCDTDSIAVINFKPEDYKNIELDPNEIGKWDIEFDNAYGVVRRPKQYFLLNGTGKKKLAFAGINFNRLALPDNEVKEFDETMKLYEQLTLKDMILGKTINNQLSSYKLVGNGIAFNEIEKDIKPVWDYEPLSEQKYFEISHFKNSLEKISQLNKISV